MELEEVKLSKLILDAAKATGLVSIVTWEYKTELDFSTRREYIQTIKRTINWLFMNITSITTGDELMLVCHKDIYDNVLSKIDIVEINKLGTMSIVINNELPVKKAILTKTLDPQTLDEFGILEILGFQKEDCENTKHGKLTIAVQDLLSELRIDETCLQAMSKGYSPDHPEFLPKDRKWKNTHCKIQISQKIAEKLRDALR